MIYIFKIGCKLLFQYINGDKIIVKYDLLHVYDFNIVFFIYFFPVGFLLLSLQLFYIFFTL